MVTSPSLIQSYKIVFVLLLILRSLSFLNITNKATMKGLNTLLLHRAWVNCSLHTSANNCSSLTQKYKVEDEQGLSYRILLILIFYYDFLESIGLGVEYSLKPCSHPIVHLDVYWHLILLIHMKLSVIGV